MKSSRKQWRNQILARVLELTVVGGLVVVVVILSQRISLVRTQVAEERLTLEASLAGAVERGVLQSELERRQHDVDRLTKMIPRQEEIDVVVAQLEAEAKRQQVVITIPSVERNISAKGGTERPVAAPKQLEEVKVKIIAQGGVANLLNFWHAVEHLPYLTGVVEYNLLGQDRPAVVGSAPLGPLTGPPGTPEIVVEERPEARLELLMLISVWPNS